jgi:DNA-binding transcriptional LysR family regulator
MSLHPPQGVELRHLHYFLAVVEELHFGHAAERVHISQPPLSQAIRTLERQVGVQLLHRTSRVVEPTEAGLAFAEHARRTLAAAGAALEAAREAGGAEWTLRVGISHYVPARVLQGLLEGLRRSGAAGRITFTDLAVSEQVRRLRDGELHVGVFAQTGNHDGLVLEPLEPAEPARAFVPRGHPLADKEVLTPDDLRGETLLTPPADGDRELNDLLLERMHDAGYSFADTREAGGDVPRDLLLGVACGHGIAIAAASTSQVCDAGAMVVERPLTEAIVLPDIVVAWQRDSLWHLRGRLTEVQEVVRERWAAANGGGPRGRAAPSPY